MVIDLVEGTTDTASVARIWSDVMRWMTLVPESVEHYRASIPTVRDWLALVDGQPVGVGFCGVNPGMEESAAAFASVQVLPHARRQGAGTALYRQVSRHAHSLEKSELEVFAFDDDPDGVAFAEHRSFKIVMRTRGLRLLLADCARPSVDTPHDVTITTLAKRPELARGVWETACEAEPDIPYDGDIPLSPGPFDQFVAIQFAGPRYIPEATFVAVHGGEVIGYAKLGWNNREAGVADHDMLAVRRAWRGKGVARALKAAQIAWALDHDLTELRTGNEERNVAARAVNAHFPYTPIPDGLVYRGPIAPGQ